VIKRNCITSEYGVLDSEEKRGVYGPNATGSQYVAKETSKTQKIDESIELKVK